MKVYVLSTGTYEQRGVIGVYTSAEAAMGKYPRGDWVKYCDGWENNEGDCADIEVFELEGEEKA